MRTSPPVCRSGMSPTSATERFRPSASRRAMWFAPSSDEGLARRGSACRLPGMMLGRFGQRLAAVLIALCTFFAAATLHAQKKQGTSVSVLIKKGQGFFDEQRYDESIQTLSAALLRPTITKEEKIQVFQLLAYNYIVLNRTEEADGAVRGLLV